MNIRIFKNSYDNCVKKSDKYPSEFFKRFVDKMFSQRFAQNPLRTAMITGYFLRCAEFNIKQRALGRPSQQILAIIESEKNNEEKIEAISNLLDHHDKIGLSDEIANYTLIPFEDIQKIFDDYGKDFIDQIVSQKKLGGVKAELFNELAYRNMAFGYLFKL
jgi:hypothetical protein